MSRGGPVRRRTSAPLTILSLWARALGAVRSRAIWPKRVRKCCCSRRAAITGTTITRCLCSTVLATEDADLKWDYYVRHYASDGRQSLDTKFVPERDGVLYPRSGTLGGCTVHNAMIPVYPQNSDWDNIARITGDASWRSQNMRKYFEKLERCQYIRRPRVNPKSGFLASILRWIPGLSKLFDNPGSHGFDGWLATNVAQPGLVIRDGQLLRVIAAAAKGAFGELLGRPLRIWEDWDTYFDPNDWRVQQTGLQSLWFTPMATNEGRRNGTREYREYIRAVQSQLPNSLTVKTDALATRVLFDDDNTAVGVEYLEGARCTGQIPGPARGPKDRRQDVYL